MTDVPGIDLAVALKAIAPIDRNRNPKKS